MVKCAVIYHSRSGNTYRMARTAAEWAKELGAEVRLLTVPELPDPMVLDRAAYDRLAAETADIAVATVDDLRWADAIIIGTPVHYGLPAPQIMNFIDHSGPAAIPGQLMNKAVTVFASGSMPHAGAQTAILALHNSMCHWGAIIVPNGSSAKVLFRAANGAPYGTASLSRHEPDNVHADNIDAIRYQTRRVLQVTNAMVRGDIDRDGPELIDRERLVELGLDY